METTPDIVEVKSLEQYKIYLRFSNGEEKIYNMKENKEEILLKKLIQFKIGYLMKKF